METPEHPAPAGGEPEFGEHADDAPHSPGESELRDDPGPEDEPEETISES